MEPGVQHVFEAIVAELVQLCPWMTEEDVGWWREVLFCHRKSSLLRGRCSPAWEFSCLAQVCKARC